MPGVLVHIRFAQMVLDRWRAEGRSPFDADDARCRTAFLHGSLGPDIGYFPKGDVLLSELAHRLRTGRMAARLLAGAATDAEVAFACGWITHVACDVRLHPLVEVEATRIARLERERAEGRWNTSGTVDLAHVRVEVGIDGIFGSRSGAFAPRLRPVFDPSGVRFIAAAFNDVYGEVTAVDEIHAAHLGVSQWHRCLGPLIRWMTADWSEDEWGAARLVAPLMRAREGGWVKYMGAGPVAAAFVSPVKPPKSVIQSFDRELDLLTEVVDRSVLDGGTMADLDLEDGRLIRESELKPAAWRTLEALERRVAERTASRSDGQRARSPVTLRKPTMKDMPMSAIRSTP